MPTPNYPPDGFPDLTLPDRTDPPAPLTPPPAVSLTPYQPPSQQSPSIMPKDAAPTRSGPWREGDRVLAPWEAHFLYFGVIQQIDNGQAHIAFSDGDEGWVFLDQIRPVALTPGQQVLCRRKPGQLHLPAQIVSVAGERIHVAFASGEDWTGVASLRIPTEPAGPDAVPTRTASHLEATRDLRPGARVWAHWMGGGLFAGTVREMNENEAHVQFDDGDAGWVKLAQILPLTIVVGQRVMGRWKMGANFYPGTITDIKQERIFVQYDDGDKEWTTTAALAMPTDIQGPNARMTSNVNGGGGSQAAGWIIWLVVVVVLAFLRAMMRGA